MPFDFEKCMQTYESATLFIKKINRNLYKDLMHDAGILWTYLYIKHIVGVFSTYLYKKSIYVLPLLNFGVVSEFWSVEVSEFGVYHNMLFDFPKWKTFQKMIFLNY